MLVRYISSDFYHPKSYKSIDDIEGNVREIAIPEEHTDTFKSLFFLHDTLREILNPEQFKEIHDPVVWAANFKANYDQWQSIKTGSLFCSVIKGYYDALCSIMYKIEYPTNDNTNDNRSA